MDRISDVERKRLMLRKVKLKARKDYALNRIRRKPVWLQRAVVCDIWAEISAIDALLDIPRAIPKAPGKPAKAPDRLGIWRGDTYGLMGAFGIDSRYITPYLDEISLPDLFLGPFDIGGAPYMALIGDSRGDRKPVALPFAHIRADALEWIFEREIPEGLDTDAIRKTLEIAASAPEGTFPDPFEAYGAYKTIADNTEAERALSDLDRKALRKVRRIRRRFGLKMHDLGKGLL